MSTRSELELAIPHLLRAREVAEFWNHPVAIVARLDLIKRAACNMRKQLLPQKEGARSMSVLTVFSDIEKRAGADAVPITPQPPEPEPHEERKHHDAGDSCLMVVIPEHQQPIACQPVLEVCGDWADVWVTSSSGYKERPMCAAHAHVVFAEWMVGI